MEERLLNQHFIKSAKSLSELIVKTIETLPVSQPNTPEAKEYNEIQSNLEKAIQLLEQR